MLPKVSGVRVGAGAPAASLATTSRVIHRLATASTTTPNESASVPTWTPDNPGICAPRKATTDMVTSRIAVP